MSNLDLYPIPVPGVISRVVDHEAVLVSPAQGKVRVLNEVGARIWELVDGARTIREIARCIVAEYSVEMTEAEADVQDFLRKLVERGIIQLSKSPEAAKK